MIRAFQWDLARQVERLDWLLAQLPRYADWGYTQLYLHLEDAVEYPSLPEVARKDAYTYRQMHRLVATAQRHGISVVPIVNLLGHTQYLIKVPALRELNELRAVDGTPLDRGQICPNHPRTLEIAEMLLRDVAPFCTAGVVHVGLDESFHLGKHPLSRQEIDRIGLPAHFARYVTRLRDLTRRLGLGMGMWADMLYFLPEAIPLLPADIAAYEWYYYGFKRRPKVELFNFRESNVGEQLVARGIEYWGCPMNGAFRYEPLPHFSDRLENILSWWRRCHRLKAAGMLITSWEPNRLAIELTTVVDAAAASLWLDGIDDPRAMLERGFERVYGDRSGARRRFREGTSTVARRAADAALSCDVFPFSGYARWQLNTRWDVASRRDDIDSIAAEERHFRRMAATGRQLPPPLRASVALRWCLAAREVWIRRTQRAWLRRRQRSDSEPTVITPREAEQLRHILRVGKAAALQMWLHSRAAADAGPNVAALNADFVRLRMGLQGEPVFGPAWQLCYRVDNFAPAAQLVVVEAEAADGTWQMLHACHTIEFQSRAAVRRNGFAREIAAPVPDPSRSLRFAVRGLGRVRLRNVQLLGSGHHILVARELRLGQSAPARGWPHLDWTRNQSVWRFSASPATRQAS